MTIFTFKYALYAGVNQGIITSLFALSSVYLAIAAYVLFNEKVTKAQTVGMFFMIL
jgi:drug/metabolite transporter (DMT)-like permease